ncbi:MAG: UbiA family prenyltransferase [Melioribacteraceae bacterium]
MLNNFLALTKDKSKCYWKLIKSYQTGLLLITGITGYISARCPAHSLYLLASLNGSLFLAISGSTILNMFYDRDIDAKMPRAMLRPLPSGKVTPSETLILGLIVSSAGLLWSFYLSYFYGVIVLSGLFIDVVLYTIWLKRRTPWSIIFGGISGGMPILAGRVLGLGSLDYVGLLFSISILLWIPIHILTFSIKYNSHYSAAGIPTFPNKYGTKNTRLIIGASSLLTPISIAIGALGLGISWGYLRLLTVLSIGILILLIASYSSLSEKINFALFKYASLYMLLAMLIVSLGILL